ncbi:MAG: 3-deoxy-D-manno-octulosonic acid transferase [Bacteroidales bacterium]|nr:3-deoxy-D-manno-octulosonic acid transferase [Bacteroidales bacterium]
MRILYTFGIRLYGLGIRIASLFSEKAKLWVNGRKHLFERMQSLLPPDSRPCVWIHASSMGEFEQARPVIELIHSQFPGHRIVVTFFSPSGYEIRKNYDLADAVLYMPLDTPRNARRFLDIVKPQVALFVKYDFWFNTLSELKKRNVPTFIFSTIFRPSQYFFKSYGRWFRRQLGTFTHFFVQNEESKTLLQGIGFENVTIAGDTRFDRVAKIAANAKENAIVERFADGKPVVMAGSSWPVDEKILHQFITTTPHDVKLIVAPHEIDDSHVSQIKRLFGSDAVCYTEITPSDDLTNYKVLIVNTMGMLSSLYRYSHIAYIGGGFGKGIHNILEAVVYGTPVCFGPNHHKFQEAKDIIALGGGAIVFSADGFSYIVNNWLSDNESWQHASDICRQYTQSNIGSSEKIFETVRNYLK